MVIREKKVGVWEVSVSETRPGRVGGGMRTRRGKEIKQEEREER